MMRQALAAALIALLGPLATVWGSAAGADEPPVVVELFTSQGCSSCPPADAMMHELAARDDVIALALHVDYWDYIGWADSFANPAFSERQRRYARVAGARTIYTPQMVIGGREHVVGAKPMHVADAMAEMRAEAGRVDLSLSRSGNTLRIDARGASAADLPLIVQLVRYVPEETVAIRRGENAGRTLSYANIVQSWQVLGEWDSGADWVAEAQIRGDDPLVVILQEPGPGTILAAARLD